MCVVAIAVTAAAGTTATTVMALPVTAITAVSTVITATADDRWRGELPISGILSSLRVLVQSVCTVAICNFGF